MKALDYFKKLNKIPRGSCNEKEVANFLCDFAKNHDLKYEIDSIYNVKIFKDNKSQKTIILQAHTDMVCEKLKEIAFDFEHQGINSLVDGDFISAQGTTLGGDDGFGVSLILEMLENCGNGYPNIEAIFTTQEEIGMDGAKEIDCQNLKGKYMLGLDGTSSNELIISCAGSNRVDFEKEYKGCCGKHICGEKNEMLYNYKLEVYGLLGGHSGEDVDKNRANANIMAFKILEKISNAGKIKFYNISGGGKDNAIPREFTAFFESDIDLDNINKIIDNYLIEFDAKYANERERKVSISLECDGNKNLLSYKESKNLIDFVVNFKNGVLESENGAVVLSINLANISLENYAVLIRTMLRFNKSELGQKALNEIALYSQSKDFKFTLRDFAPFFEAGKENQLQKICEETYYKCGFKDLKILNIHAGLEGGVFTSKIPGLQIVVLGADLFDIHTPNERMRISSLDKLSIWIKEIMKSIQEM